MPFRLMLYLQKLWQSIQVMRINVITQALQAQDGSLPQGLTVQNAYTKLRKGSKKVIVVVRNSMAYPQTLWKKTLDS